MEDQILLSPEGREKLTGELEQLKTVRRREVAARIKAARQFGDLSENAEYDEAKNEQGFVEGRILELEKVLGLAVVVDGDGVDPDEITIGSTVTLEDKVSGKSVDYTIVSPPEADPAASRISYLSPVGKAVFGLRPGAQVKIRLPRGTVEYSIVSVRR